MSYHRLIKLTFIDVERITVFSDLEGNRAVSLVKGTQDMISQFHVTDYEIIYLYKRATYTQDNAEVWLHQQNILYPSSQYGLPPRLLFSKPEAFFHKIEDDCWKIGVIQMMAAQRKADEIAIVSKNSSWIHSFLESHPDRDDHRHAETKHYPHYKVTLYEEVKDVPITFLD